MRAGGRQRRSVRRGEKKKIYFPCWESKRNSSAVQPEVVAIPTELSRFLAASIETKNEAPAVHFAMTVYRGPEDKDECILDVNYSWR
jgi:hypothetical protein